MVFFSSVLPLLPSVVEPLTHPWLSGPARRPGARPCGGLQVPLLSVGAQVVFGGGPWGRLRGLPTSGCWAPPALPSPCWVTACSACPCCVCLSREPPDPGERAGCRGFDAVDHDARLRVAQGSLTATRGRAMRLRSPCCPGAPALYLLRAVCLPGPGRGQGCRRLSGSPPAKAAEREWSLALCGAGPCLFRPHLRP
jgi:hypothetical protein